MLGMNLTSVSGVATAKFREGFREGDCASQISRRVGADVVSAIADRVKFRRKARWTQILYRKANGGAQKDFRDTETNSEAPTPTSAFEGSTARAAMFPVRGSRKIPSPDRG
ncbi:hypothetical protein MS6194_04029 [Escherichia coli]|nr:hypothetical protein [Escherichia coli]